MNSQQKTELSFKEKLIAALNDHWKLVVIIIAAAVVVMAGVLVLDYVNDKRKLASSELAEDIQEAYADWISDSSDSKDDNALMELINEALADYPRHFAAQRATYTKALMAIENEEWETAYTLFEEVAATWSDSYLASVSLFSAGSAREEAGDLDGAIADWQMVVEDYATISADTPEALFNIGRVEETRGNVEAAVAAYKTIGASYPESRWTDISKSRILVLESR